MPYPQPRPVEPVNCGDIVIGFVLFVVFPPLTVLYILYRTGVIGKRYRRGSRHTAPGHAYQNGPANVRYQNPQNQAQNSTSRTVNTRASSPKRVKIDLSKVQDETIRKALQGAVDQLEYIREFEAKQGGEIKNKVHEIGDLVEEIIKEIIRDPDDYKRAKQFLNYYLETTAKIFKKYEELDVMGVTATNVQSSKERAVKMMDTLIDAFKKQLAKLKENDVMQMEVEMDVLEKTLRMEGF